MVIPYIPILVLPETHPSLSFYLSVWERERERERERESMLSKLRKKLGKVLGYWDFSGWVPLFMVSCTTETADVDIIYSCSIRDDSCTNSWCKVAVDSALTKKEFIRCLAKIKQEQAAN